MSLEPLHRCNFEGGFFIDVDGIPWSDGSAIDGYLTSTWFQALKDILNGKVESKAKPWEESRLTLKLKGEELELEDISSSGHVSMPKIRVLFLEFVEQIIANSTKLLQLIAELEQEITFRRSHGVSEAVESKLKHLEQTLPGEYWHKDVQDLVVLLSEYRDRKE
jgi:hypothetical protein